MRACSILRLETNVDDLPNKIAVAVVRNTGFTQFNVLKAICVIKFSLFQNKNTAVSAKDLDGYCPGNTNFKQLVIVIFYV